jgi:2,5-diketo-D-gluconate reductase A
MGFGTYKVESAKVLIQAIKIGYRHFDLAEAYDNLEMVNQTFKFVSNGGIKNTERKDFFVTMKIHSLSDRDHIIRLLDACYLKYFDLLILHSPFRAFRSVGILQCSGDCFVNVRRKN